MENRYVDSLAIFVTRVNDLMESKFILIDKPISSLLKCIASITDFTETIANTTTNVSYVSEFQRARTQYTANDGSIKYRLNLPQEKARLFTFVVCLLAEIDSKQRNFVVFLNEYFADNDNNASYIKFCDAVIKPFRRAGESILNKSDVIDMSSLDNQPVKLAERFFQSEKVYITSNAQTQLQDEIAQLVEKIASEHYTTPTQRAEMSEVLEGFSKAITAKNSRLIKLMYVACKNTLIVGKMQDNLNKIASILTNSNLI